MSGKKQLEYDVCYSETAEGLARSVKHRLDYGWKPQGGICAYVFPRDSWPDDPGPHVSFAQAVIRETPATNPRLKK